MSESKLEPVARNPLGSVTTTFRCREACRWPIVDELRALQRHSRRRSSVYAVAQRDGLRRLIDDRLRRGRRYRGSVPVEGHARVLKNRERAALRALALVRACKQIVVDAVVDLLNEVHGPMDGPLPLISSTTGVAVPTAWAAGAGVALGGWGLHPAARKPSTAKIARGRVTRSIVGPATAPRSRERKTHRRHPQSENYHGHRIDEPLHGDADQSRRHAARGTIAMAAREQCAAQLAAKRQKIHATAVTPAIPNSAKNVSRDRVRETPSGPHPAHARAHRAAKS